MKEKSLKFNFVMNSILTMSSFIFPLITFPYVSRILQPSGMGKVNFVNSVITYFNMFAQLGIPTYGIRACAAVRDDKQKLTKTAQELLILNITMAIIAYIVLAIAIVSVPRLWNDRELCIITSFTIGLTAIGMDWLYQALEQYAYITVRSLIFKVISVVAMFLLVHTKSDYVIYGTITTFASGGSFVLNLINAHKYIGFKPVGNYNFKKHLRPIIILFAMSIASTIYTNLDTVMLGFMKGDAEVGYYSAAVKVKTILVSIVTSLGVVLLPRSSYYLEKNETDRFMYLCKKAMNFVVLIATPLMIYFIIFAKNGIYFLSGSSYQKAIMPMQIIMPTVLFIGMSNLTGIQMLIPLDKENVVLISTILGAILDFAINLFLIPKIGSSGAAIGTVAAEILVFIYQYGYMRNNEMIGNVFENVKLWKIVLANAVAILSCLWVTRLQINDFFILVISCIIYFGVYLIVLLLTRENLTCELTTQMISKIKKEVF